MQDYLKKVISFLDSLGYGTETISRILGVSVDTVKEFILIIKKGGSHNGLNCKTYLYVC